MTSYDAIFIASCEGTCVLIKVINYIINLSNPY